MLNIYIYIYIYMYIIILYLRNEFEYALLNHILISHIDQEMI